MHILAVRPLRALCRPLWLVLAALAVFATLPARAAWVATPWVPPLGGQVLAMANHPYGTANGILVGGESLSSSGTAGRGIMRLNAATLALDASFAADVTLGAGGGTVNAIWVDSFGGIFIGGTFDQVNGQPRNNIARLLPDGTLDNAFNVSVTGGAVRAIAMQSDNSVVIGGAFTQVNATPAPYLARITPFYALDGSFTNPGFNNSVLALGVQFIDDKIVVGGFFSQSNGQPRRGLVRLAANGSADALFTTDPAVTGWVNALFIQPSNGNILIGGNLNQVGGQPRTGLARVNGNGALDATFTVDTDGSVYGFARQAGTSVVIVGGFESVGSVLLRRRVARIDTSGAGALDPSLTDVGVINAGFIVNAAVSRSNDDILIGGWFAYVDGQPRNGLAEIADAPGTPLAPAITQAQPGNGQVLLTIAPPASPPASPITGYDITCTPFGPGAPATLTNAASPAAVTGLANGTPYECTARARNALGAGPASVPTAAFVPTGPAGAAASIPTLSEWGLMLLALACAALGMRRVRRVQYA